MGLVGIDPRTALLAIQLQLADIQSVLQDPNEGVDCIAWNIMQDELERSLLLLQDQAFAMDLLKEDQDNQAMIDELLREERQAEEDHELACRIRGIANEHVPLSKRGDMVQPPKANDEDQDLNLT